VVSSGIAGRLGQQEDRFCHRFLGAPFVLAMMMLQPRSPVLFMLMAFFRRTDQ